jgi:hypothetical protein
MAAPDFTGITTGLGRARAAVANAKSKVPSDVVPELESVEAHLAEVEKSVEEARARAEQGGGGRPE